MGKKHLSPSGFPEELHGAMMKQVAPVVQNSCQEWFWWSLPDRQVLPDVAEPTAQWQHSIDLLGHKLVGLATHLQFSAVSVLRERLPGQGSLSGRARPIVLPSRRAAPSQEELQATLAVMLHELLYLLTWPVHPISSATPQQVPGVCLHGQPQQYTPDSNTQHGCTAV